MDAPAVHFVKADRDCRRDHYMMVADLHIQEIHHGALPLLGRGFLARLYRALAEASGGGVWFAVHDNTVVGFIAGAADTKRVFGAMFWGDGLSLLVRAAGHAICRPRVAVELLQIVRHLLCRRSPGSARRNTNAELLAIAVSARFHHRGIGKRLLALLERSLQDAGVSEYVVSTNQQELVSNAFYRSTGFEPVNTHRLHRLTIQEYSKRIAQN